MSALDWFAFAMTAATALCVAVWIVVGVFVIIGLWGLVVGKRYE